MRFTQMEFYLNASRAEGHYIKSVRNVSSTTLAFAKSVFQPSAMMDFQPRQMVFPPGAATAGDGGKWNLICRSENLSCGTLVDAARQPGRRKFLSNSTFLPVVFCSREPTQTLTSNISKI
ncbi:hypothetical protein NPIL_214781 [Nephila pilipes]|uniref:Uncharacterized protein n=1 Tax=Nephila pilipes TaxID=299642 RepID=A0A8X6N8I5_NEPPI|nr:hypothetical protein NPIL_214781 [Nephila pilipes]